MFKPEKQSDSGGEIISPQSVFKHFLSLDHCHISCLYCSDLSYSVVSRYWYSLAESLSWLGCDNIITGLVVRSLAPSVHVWKVSLNTEPQIYPDIDKMFSNMSYVLLHEMRDCLNALDKDKMHHGAAKLCVSLNKLNIKSFLSLINLWKWNSFVLVSSEFCSLSALEK